MKSLKMKSTKSILTLTGLAVIATALATPVPTANAMALAGACPKLWTARNQIYKNNGYCFKTPVAIKRFGNAGCRFDDQSDVRLSKWERREVNNIVKLEREIGCSG